MITSKLKANAIALLKMGDTIEHVSEELEIPFMLVKEWYNELDQKDLIALNANALALTKYVAKEIEEHPDRVEELKGKIEEVAIEIVKKVTENTTSWPDIIVAKALNLHADTCSKLYNTVINKGQAPKTDTPGEKAMSMLEQMGRD